MMPAPLVSVVIPAYQHAAYVGRAVESVLEQTVQDLEVIVVDDGSTDGTPDRVEAIGDPRVRLVRLADNRRDHARNRGLGMATGRHVAFQNSDDEWLPDKLARQLAVLERQPEVGLVFTEVAFIDGHGASIDGGAVGAAFSEGRGERSTDDWLRLLANRNCFCITSALVRHDLLREVGGFRPSLVQLSDQDMWIRLAARAELRVVAAPLTRMRLLGDRNLSAPRPDTTARSMLEMADVMENYAREPLLARLPRLFPDAFPGGASGDPDADLAAFACYAARHGQLWHRLFADRVLSRLLDDPVSRERVVAVHGGAIVRCFIERRGLWANVAAGQ
jgi:glycosyltransferase involved in cell wall biosynthesis